MNANNAYDANGNTQTMVNSSGTTTYSWDFENRLVSAALPGSGGTVTFKYDPFGRRIYKSSSSGTSIYAYDGDNLVEETTSSGTAVARYSQTLNVDEPLAMLRSSATSYYQQDGLGTVTSLSNTSGALAQTYTFDSFGKQTGSSGSLTNWFQYTARESDAETSLYYYRARYYDQATGRFLNEDPAKAGRNLYRYVHNNPVQGKDPLGLWDTYTHSALIWNALAHCGVDPNLIYAMQEESKAWDRATGLDPFFANAHSMASPGQSPGDAKTGINNFISDQLDISNWAWSNGYDYYYINFTHAIHAQMDSTSPAHVAPNGDPYVWPTVPNALQHGDEPLSIETWANMTPGLMQKNIDMIRKSWTKMIGQTLNCGCQ